MRDGDRDENLDSGTDRHLCGQRFIYENFLADIIFVLSPLVPSKNHY